MSSEAERDRSVARNLGIAVVCAVLAALLINQFVAPRAAHWVFSRVPVEQLVKLDKKGDRATRRFVTSFIAGLIGPANPERHRARQPRAGDGGGDVGVATGESKSRQGGRRSGASGAAARDPSSSGSTEQGATGTSRDDGRGGDSSGKSKKKADEGGPEIPAETPVYTVDRRELNGRLDKPEQVRNQITVVSNRNGPKGLRVLALKGFYGNFGLQPGDVVMSVNGKSVPTRQHAIRHLMRMREQTLFRVSVWRGGETFEIRYKAPKVR